MNALMGGKNNQKPQSGLESIAGSFLHGPQQTGSNQNSNSAGGGGLAGQLIGQFLGGKPHDQSQQGSSSGYQGSSSTPNNQHSSGFSAAASALFGSNHASSASRQLKVSLRSNI